MLNSFDATIKRAMIHALLRKSQLQAGTRTRYVVESSSGWVRGCCLLAKPSSDTIAQVQPMGQAQKCELAHFFTRQVFTAPASYGLSACVSRAVGVLTLLPSLAMMRLPQCLQE